MNTLTEETDLLRRGKPGVTMSDPVPIQTSALPSQPTSQPSSYGSSGSAFLSSVLNPAGSSYGQISHTPPTASSYEVSHFGKRARSGSVSGRLLSASDYLERKGLLDRQTKGILKDLLIIGDEELQNALDRYEGGDPSMLEKMISSGALQERLPKDLDLLGDLDLDFLNVNDDGITPMDDGDMGMLQDYAGSSMGKVGGDGRPPLSSTAMAQPSSTVSYDGIGDIHFGDLDNFQGDRSISSREPSAPASPTDHVPMSDYERRMRSNSLFSALLNDPKSNASQVGEAVNDPQYGRWMDRYLDPPVVSNPVPVPSAPRPAVPRPAASSAGGGIGASLEAERKRREKEEKKEQRAKERQERKQKKEKKKVEDDAMVEEHVPGSGRPRSLSDPNLQSSLDENGLRTVERPDGWVGAYSPDSRALRIKRFLEKRNHRVWSKVW